LKVGKESCEVNLITKDKKPFSLIATNLNKYITLIDITELKEAEFHEIVRKI
jgi:hypothetical protein